MGRYLHRYRWLIVVAVGWLIFLLWVTTVPAAASVEPPPSGGGGIDLGGLGDAFRDAIASGLNDWLNTWTTTSGPLSVPVTVLRGFLKGLGWLGTNLLSGIATQAGASDYDMVSRISTRATLDDPTVRNIFNATRLSVAAIVGVGATVLGFLMVIRSVPAQDVALFLPRVGIGTFLVVRGYDLMRAAIGVANGLTDAWASNAFGQMAQTAQGIDAERAGATILAVGIAAAFVAVMRIALHGLLDVLVMTAPLALAVWMVPMWSRWFWRWASLFAGVCVTSVLQSLVLAGGAGMLAGALARTNGDNRDLVAGVTAFTMLGLAGVVPALAGISLGGVAVVGAVNRLSGVVNKQMRQKVRTPSLPNSGAEPGTDAAGEGDVVDAEFKEKEYPDVEGYPKMGTVTLHRIPQHGPVRQGGETRLVLPPPDYLRDEYESQRPID